MPDRRTYLELLHGEIDAAAKQLARELTQGVAEGLTQGVETNADIHQLIDTDTIPNEEVENLVVPGFLAQTFWHIGLEATRAAKGWNDIFFANLHDRYEKEGGIET